jgi:TnpA family transposase
VEAVELMRSLQVGSRQSALAWAIGEAGRAPKTLHLLPFYDDEVYRQASRRSSTVAMPTL